MAKAVEAFRTIGEVSDELDVPKHVLRFWEGRFPQLKPMKRGGGRRFYRPEDVLLLRGIHHLLHKAGYTIKGVQRILREHGVDTVKLDDGASAPLAAQMPPAPSDTPAAKPSRGRSGGKSDPVAPLSKAQRSVVAQVVAELEECLGLLKRAA
jgi:DNA-binding transcriptional MerR regulator